jgi:hypothetical protein
MIPTQPSYGMKRASVGMIVLISTRLVVLEDCDCIEIAAHVVRLQRVRRGTEAKGQA